LREFLHLKAKMYGHFGGFMIVFTRKTKQGEKL
jgi:hypothetical protein